MAAHFPIDESCLQVVWIARKTQPKWFADCDVKSFTNNLYEFIKLNSRTHKANQFFAILFGSESQKRATSISDWNTGSYWHRLFRRMFYKNRLKSGLLCKNRYNLCPKRIVRFTSQPHCVTVLYFNDFQTN